MVVGLAVYVAVSVETFDLGGQSAGALGTLEARGVPSLVDGEQIVPVEDLQATAVAQVHLGWLLALGPHHHVGRRLAVRAVRRHEAGRRGRLGRPVPHDCVVVVVMPLLVVLRLLLLLVVLVVSQRRRAAHADEAGDRVAFLFAGQRQRAAAVVVAAPHRRRRRHLAAVRAVVVELGLERAALPEAARARHAADAKHVGQLLAAARRGRQVRAQVSGRIVRVGKHGVVAVMLLKCIQRTVRRIITLLYITILGNNMYLGVIDVSK